MEYIIAILLAVVAYYIGYRQGVKTQLGLVQKWLLNKHNLYLSEKERLERLLPLEEDREVVEDLKYKIETKAQVISFLENEVEKDFF